MRAKALLSVSAGKTFAVAARECGQASGDTIAKWVSRFNEEGITAIVPRHGGGRRPAYGPNDRQRIIEIARTPPVSSVDGVSGWSLATLRQHLIDQDLPAPSIFTLWNILREADLDWLNQRSTRKNRLASRKSMALNKTNTRVKNYAA